MSKMTRILLLLLLLSVCVTAEPVRLPRPRGDVRIWGALINQFLRVSHNEDGTLKASAISESDPCFAASDVNAVTDTNIGRWDSAYGWGDHGSGGYLKADGSVPLAGAWDMGSQNLTNVDIDSGTIDGVSIGTASVATVANIDDLHLDGGTIRALTGDLDLDSANNKVRVTAQDDVRITGGDDIVFTATDETNFNSGTTIEFRPSGDPDDYIEMKTSNHIPEIDTSGGCDLKINAHSGEVTSTSNWTTTGTVDWSGGGSANANTAYGHSATTHDYAYISGNDGATNVSAAELEELSDGSETALHIHDSMYYTETETDTWRSNVTQTEMSYVDGVTSDIQTQIGGKLANIVEDASPELGADLDGQSTCDLTNIVDAEFEGAIGVGTIPAASTIAGFSKTFDPGTNIGYGLNVQAVFNRETQSVGAYGLNFNVTHNPTLTANRSIVNVAGSFGMAVAKPLTDTFDFDISSGYGYYGFVRAWRGSGSGTVTMGNAYAYYASGAIATNATITNGYGLYCAAQTGSSNNYGIYVAGAVDSTSAYFEGDISADDVTDRAQWSSWAGTSKEALDAIVAIDNRDHSTYPKSVQRTFIEQRPNGEKEIVEVGDQLIEKDITESVEVCGRSLSATVTMLVEATKELRARNKALEARIDKLENPEVAGFRYSGLLTVIPVLVLFVAVVHAKLKKKNIGD